MAIALAVGIAALILLLALQVPFAALSGENLPSFIYTITLLVILIISLVTYRHVRPGDILKNLAIWLAIIVTLMLGYSYRHEAAEIGNRLIAELMPSRGAVVDGAVTFREQQDGHYVIDAKVDGVPVRFLVDTGASDVTLTPRDAKRLGYDIRHLDFHRTYRTANGVVKGAPVRLRRVAIGPISMPNVSASVNAVEMDLSLLGMNFLSRLSSFEMAKGTLTLRP